MATVNLGRVSFVMKGAYSTSATYKRQDVVTDGGASYAAKKDVLANTALTNTEYWQKLVETVAGVEIGDTATYATTELLFNPEGTNEHTVPEVDDDSVSEGDTWSSSKINGELSDLKSAMDGISEQGAEITGDIIAFDKTRKTITQIAISDTSATSATITRCGINIYPKYSAGSANNLSWEVASDGTITFTGTPSADTLLRMYNQNIPVRNGEKKTLAFFNNKADTNNRLSFFMITSAGNPQVNMNTTDKVAVITHPSDASCTELRLRIPANFDATGLIIKPMIVIGEVDIQQFEEYNGQTFSVTVDGGVVQGSSITYLNGVNTMWSSVGDIAITYDETKQIAEYVDKKVDSVLDSFYQYETSGSARYLYIYYKSGANYVRWQLHNVPASSSNSDTWQIGRICGLDGNFGNLTEIVRGGEFELAFKENGAADYCGGNNHGDETTDEFKLFIDGKLITDLSTLADGKRHPFSRIDAFEIATVNRCNTPSQDILKHQKIWTFEHGTVKVRQTIKFLVQLVVDTALVCMFAALRSSFKYGVRKGGVAIEDMTTATYDKTYTMSDDVFYEMYGDNVTAKIHASTDNPENKSIMWINNTADLNKLYYGYYGYTDSGHPTTVPADTVITAESEYDVAYTPAM